MTYCLAVITTNNEYTGRIIYIKNVDKVGYMTWAYS